MSRRKIVIKTKGETPQEPVVEKQAEIQEEIQPTQSVPEIQEEIPSELAPKKRNFLIPILVSILGGVVLIGGTLYYFFFYNSTPDKDIDSKIEAQFIESTNNNLYGNYDDYEKDILSETTQFSSLLDKFGIARGDMASLNSQAKSENIFRLRKGDKYSVYFKEEVPQLIVVEPKNNPKSKLEIDLNEIKITRKFKESVIKKEELAVIIQGNLAVTFMQNNLNFQLVNQIEEIFKYSFDLFRLDDGDRLKLIYEQEYLDNKPYKIKGILSAKISEGGKDYYGFRIKQGGKLEYFNEFGMSLKRSFLTSPIKYGGIITSGYGLRTHPIYQSEKMHFGTDYGAPQGTPIVATADGRVSIRNFTSKNGNYIKLKHDNTFETQYLHMEKFKESVKQGSYVKQGDVIGYVGMTGSATGPHVCYRFWKKKQQVDPFENITSGMQKIPVSKREEYFNYIDPIKTSLKKIDYL